jgi:hypothetical protein
MAASSTGWGPSGRRSNPAFRTDREDPGHKRPAASDETDLAAAEPPSIESSSAVTPEVAGSSPVAPVKCSAVSSGFSVVRAERFLRFDEVLEFGRPTVHQNRLLLRRGLRTVKRQHVDVEEGASKLREKPHVAAEKGGFTLQSATIWLEAQSGG